MFKLFVSGLGAWIISVSTYIVLSLMGKPVSPIGLLLLFMILTIIGYITMDKVLSFVTRGLSNMVSDSILDKEGIDILGEDVVDEVYNDDKMFLVWGFISGLVREMTDRRPDIILVVHEEGIPVTSYPEAATMLEIDYDETGLEVKPQVKFTGKNMLVTITIEDYFTIRELLEREEGIAVIESEREIEKVYDIAKNIAEAMNQGANNAFISYIAYKSIIKMKTRGAIRIPERLLAKIPFEDNETKERIIRQVKEETLLGEHNT